MWTFYWSKSGGASYLDPNYDTNRLQGNMNNWRLFSEQANERSHTHLTPSILQSMMILVMHWCMVKDMIYKIGRF